MQGDLLAGFTLPEPKDLDEMYTPPDLFALWDHEFRFSIDVCATAESAKLERYWHAGQNCLVQDWAGERVFMNPPYSRLWDFTEKVDHAIRSGCELVVGLYPGDRGEQPFWHNYIELYRDLPIGLERDSRGVGWKVPRRLRRCFTLETRNIEGRIRFGQPGDPHGRSRQTGKFPSVLVIWRANP